MKELKEFYHAYSDWVHCGAIEDRPFTRHQGLCAALVRYGHLGGWNFAQRNHAAAAMKAQFDRAGLSMQYPFNTTQSDYEIEIRRGEAYLNSDRIMWVRKEWLHHV